MRFLRTEDYMRTIQLKNLMEVIEGNEDYLLAVEQTAIAEITSYLVQRYQMNKVFTDTTSFDIGANYYGKNLIEYTEDYYSASTVYVTNDRVVFEGYLYKSVSGSTNVAPSTGFTQWNKIAKDKTLYYAKTSSPEYSNKTTYAIGSQVWYDNIIYTALQQTQGVYPDSNTSVWSPDSTYTFTGQYPDNTTYWVKGDNRNQQIVQAVMSVALYYAHSRISPRNIPELRQINYDGANAHQTGGVIGWLKSVGAGSVTADLPEVLPEATQSRSIIWGSVRRNNNFY